MPRRRENLERGFLKVISHNFIKKESKKIVMFSHDKAKSNFAIMSVYKSGNIKLKLYFTNNLSIFILIYYSKPKRL